MKLKLIALAVSSILSMGVAQAQCNNSSAGSTWVGENARNMQPGQAGMSNGGGGGLMGAASGMGGGAMGSGMGQMGGWSGGSLGGSGSNGGFLNSAANTVGLGALTSDKEFTLSDAAKLASTATTVYGVATGDQKVAAIGMAGMAASNKFSGQIDNFGTKVADGASSAWNNMGSSGTTQAGGYDSEFGAPGDYDKAVAQQASSNSSSGVSGWFGSGSSNSGTSGDFNITGSDIRQAGAVVGAGMTIMGKGDQGMGVAMLSQAAGGIVDGPPKNYQGGNYQAVQYQMQNDAQNRMNQVFQGNISGNSNYQQTQYQQQYQQPQQQYQQPQQQQQMRPGYASELYDRIMKDDAKCRPGDICHSYGKRY